MRSQLTWTTLTELVVMASGILILKLAAQFLGPVGFGEYTVSRRAVNLLYLPLVMGLGIAAPRYISIALAGAMPGYSARSFAFATLTAGLAPALVAVFLLNAVPGAASKLLFGTIAMKHLVMPATLALAGISLHALVYSVLRGRGQMMVANILQLINNGFVPVSVFLVTSHSAAALLAATGSTWIVISTVALIAVIVSNPAQESGTSSVRSHLRTLLRFGLPRVPGEFALIGLFAIPSLIALREQGIVQAGHFSAGMSILTTIASGFAPIGLVVLPRASAQVATGNLAGMRQLVLKLAGGGVAMAAIAVVMGELLVPHFVRWYFGAAFEPAIPVIRICLLGAVPYSLYVLLRNFLDALDVKAVNSRNLAISLVVLVSLCLIRPRIEWMAASLVAALTLLSVLSVRATRIRLTRAPTPTPAPLPA
ncbi:MAG TPA: lipopolysaccharide biosynthesis protein [Gemmatimonadaceae bacterium]|jgi:O-antigen/teichoic acid export membrane protein